MRSGIYSRLGPWLSGYSRHACHGVFDLTVVSLAFASVFAGINAEAQRTPASITNPPSTVHSPAVQQPTPTAGPEPAAAATAEEIPPSAPEITYADGQLTINAANSTLGEILKAIRTVMGADIDIPPKALRERMAAKLGPGPAREVLSSLLSWTDYNYLIQASDTDPNGIQSVALTARSKAAAGSVADRGREQSAGNWSRRASEPKVAPTEETAEDNVAPGSADNPAAPASAQAASVGEQPAPASTQSSTAATGNASEVASASTQQNATQAQSQAQAELASSATSESAGGDQAAKNAERMTQLQSLYEQRKQMVEEARKPSAQN